MAVPLSSVSVFANTLAPINMVWKTQNCSFTALRFGSNMYLYTGKSDYFPNGMESLD